MKKLITIILSLIMTFFSAPNQGADEPHVTVVKTPQTAIVTQVVASARRKRKARRNGVCVRGDGGSNNCRSAKE